MLNIKEVRKIQDFIKQHYKEYVYKMVGIQSGRIL